MSKTVMAVGPADAFNRLVAGAEEVTDNLDAPSDATLLAVELSFRKRFLERS